MKSPVCREQREQKEKVWLTKVISATENITSSGTACCELRKGGKDDGAPPSSFDGVVQNESHGDKIIPDKGRASCRKSRTQSIQWVCVEVSGLCKTCTNQRFGAAHRFW